MLPHYHLWPEDWAKALYAFPTFGVSFLCHFNALPTHQELARPTRHRMRRVILVTLTLTSAPQISNQSQVKCHCMFIPQLSFMYL